MNFENLEEKASCPYNPNHIFDKEKLLFHLNRCKDKQKIGHLFKSCRFNSLHIIRKEDIEGHQLICSDSAEIQSLLRELKTTLVELRDERERSRQKVKREAVQKEEGMKLEVKQEHLEEIDLESCPLCAKILQDLDSIKKCASSETLSKIAKAEKLVKIHHQLGRTKK